MRSIPAHDTRSKVTVRYNLASLKGQERLGHSVYHFRTYNVHLIFQQTAFMTSPREGRNRGQKKGDEAVGGWR